MMYPLVATSVQPPPTPTTEQACCKKAALGKPRPVARDQQAMTHMSTLKTPLTSYGAPACRSRCSKLGQCCSSRPTRSLMWQPSWARLTPWRVRWARLGCRKGCRGARLVRLRAEPSVRHRLAVLLHQEPAGVCIQRRVGPVGVSNMIGWDPGSTMAMA